MAGDLVRWGSVRPGRVGSWSRREGRYWMSPALHCDQAAGTPTMGRDRDLPVYLSHRLIHVKLMRRLTGMAEARSPLRGEALRSKDNVIHRAGDCDGR
ncbi:MAG: hypothetical protein H5T86_00345 [Armatimonadetes bacterium]|nr:hypothetical protein [Armatimonadota bacterium]